MNEGFGIVNFAVGTGILYGLTYLVIVPIVRALSRSEKSMTDRDDRVPAPSTSPDQSESAYLPDDEGKASDQKKVDAIDQLPTGLFIAVSVVVMGLTGFGFGIAGYDIFGFSLKGKMWPGLIAMALGSIIGAVFHEGRFLGQPF